MIELLGSVILRPPFSWLLALLLAHLALGAAIWFLSPGAETVWFHLGRWLTAIQDADSWEPIEAAWARVLGTQTGVYGVFFTDHVKFQYPPAALTIFGGVSRPLLNAVSWTATLCTALLTAAILDRAVEQSNAPKWSVAERAGLAVMAAAGTLTFYPIVKGYSLGQVQTVVTLLFAALLLCWQRGRNALAGATFGAMLLIKPSWAPLLLWAIVRREWRFALAASLTAAAGILASLARFALSDYVDYAHVLSYIGARGETFFPNQSINGLLNRLIADGGSLIWQAASFPNPHPVVAVGTFAAAALLLGASLAAVPSAWRGSIVDLSTLALATTMTAPIAWEHHYGILAPLGAASWPAIARARPLGRLTGSMVFCAALIAANYFQAAHRFDGTPFNPLQSYLLGAALVLWWLLLRAQRGVTA